MKKLFARFISSERPVSAQVLRYVISGGTVAATELTLLYVFTDIFGIWYLFSLVLAFAVSIFVSFTLQKFWTFQNSSTKTLHVQAPLYLFVVLMDLVINSVLLYLLVQFAGVWYLFAQVLITVLIASWNFLIYKFIIFKKRRTSTDDSVSHPYS